MYKSFTEKNRKKVSEGILKFATPNSPQNGILIPKNDNQLKSQENNSKGSSTNVTPRPKPTITKKGKMNSIINSNTLDKNDRTKTLPTEFPFESKVSNKIQILKQILKQFLFLSTIIIYIYLERNGND